MKHQPVLLKEVIEYLNPQSGEDFIDATFGEGGHAQEILKLTSPSGKLLGIDWDQEAFKKGSHPSHKATEGERFRLDTGSAYLKASEPLTVPTETSELSWSGIEPESLKKFQDRLFLEVGNFADIADIASRFNLDKVDGVLFDFGFRSYHIDESGRGFSYTKDEPLDMRYNTESNLTVPTSEVGTPTKSVGATDIVNDWSESELARIFKEFGEERDSRKIAKAIIEARKQRKILTTNELVMVIDGVISGYRVKTYSRIFQALRIVVNNELENIKKGLAGAWNILKPNGRLVAISFHSLEDRIVKNFFNDKKQVGEGIVLTKKPVTALAEELNKNTRSRSAKLRAIEKRHQYTRFAKASARRANTLE